MFCGDSDMEGLGIRVLYNTGRRCSNLPGKTVYKYLDGTKSKVPEEIRRRLGTSCAAIGVIPQVLGALDDFMPEDLIGAGNTSSVYCEEVVAPVNTEDEIKKLKASGIIPQSNKTAIPYTDEGEIDWNKIRTYCSNGTFKNCNKATVQVDKEGFSNNSTNSDNSKEMINYAIGFGIVLLLILVFRKHIF